MNAHPGLDLTRPGAAQGVELAGLAVRSLAGPGESARLAHDLLRCKIALLLSEGHAEALSSALAYDADSEVAGLLRRMVAEHSSRLVCEPPPGATDPAPARATALFAIPILHDAATACPAGARLDRAARERLERVLICTGLLGPECASRIFPALTPLEALAGDSAVRHHRWLVHALEAFDAAGAPDPGIERCANAVADPEADDGLAVIYLTGALRGPLAQIEALFTAAAGDPLGVEDLDRPGFGGSAALSRAELDEAVSSFNACLREVLGAQFGIRPRAPSALHALSDAPAAGARHRRAVRYRQRLDALLRGLEPSRLRCAIRLVEEDTVRGIHVVVATRDGVRLLDDVMTLGAEERDAVVRAVDDIALPLEARGITYDSRLLAPQGAPRAHPAH